MPLIEMGLIDHLLDVGPPSYLRVLIYKVEGTAIPTLHGVSQAGRTEHTQASFHSAKKSVSMHRLLAIIMESMVVRNLSDASETWIHTQSMRVTSVGKSV